MTAYIVFKKLKAGSLRLDQKILVSPLAASQEPSKIGMRPGSTISVDLALQTLLVYSANDMAYVLAEGANGTVFNFVQEMNATAQKLGLNATHFVNPNGLFDPRQLTSARDIGVLAAVIISEFPEHGRYFSQQHVAIGKRKLMNRNSLIRTMPEADGMKTGFVCNSGFNLVASATRGGRRLDCRCSRRSQFRKPCRDRTDASDRWIFKGLIAKPPPPGANFRQSRWVQLCPPI